VSDKIEKVARDQDLAAFFGGILTDIVSQLTEVASNLASLIAGILP